MEERALRRLLRQVRSKKVAVDAALRQLKDLPFAELGYATLDTHRQLRVGFPEVVFGELKSVEHLSGIIDTLRRRKQPVLITRVQQEKGEVLSERYPAGRYHPIARIFEISVQRPHQGRVAVVTAGTSDVPVAEEAAVTAEALGARVSRIFDVGVAGIHRLLRRRAEIQ